MKDTELTCKVVLLGETGVGKTTFLMRYHKGIFECDHKSTIGVDFRSFHRDVGTEKVKVQMWDTAGQERFRSITRLYYQNTNGILLFYDTTDLKTFNQLSSWIDDYCTASVSTKLATIVIVGTKCDMVENRQVEAQMVSDFCLTHGCRFIETSSKNNFNIQAAMNLLLSQMQTDDNFVKIRTEKIQLSDDDSWAFGCC
jgi:small GTP-binding protein